MSRRKKASYRRACLCAAREGDDAPSKRAWRKNNRQARKRTMLEYRAAVRRATALNAAIKQGTWPDNHALWMEANRNHDTIVWCEMVLGMKALAWRQRHRKGVV